MTDSQFIQKELRNEIRERKNVGYSARNRICGSKSKRLATLPSDSLTPKQWKERNGQVMTYNIAEPMSWKDFSAMPQDIQKQYISKLKDKYSVSGTTLSKAFGVSYNTMMRRVQLLGMGDRFTRKIKMSKDDENKFHVFWNRTGAGSEDVQRDEPAAQPTECTVSVDESPIECPVPFHDGAMGLTESSFTFRGQFNPTQIINTLRMVIKDNVPVNIEIRCSPA